MALAVYCNSVFVQQSDAIVVCLQYPEPEWLSTEEARSSINVAVVGSSGSGKSSLINALRGMLPPYEDADATAAPVDTTECTKFPPRSYTFPEDHALRSKLNIWDLPGAGTMKVPAGYGYIRQTGLRYYDLVLVISADRLETVHGETITELKKLGVPYFLVRNKIDLVYAHAEKHRRSLSKELVKAKADIATQCRVSEGRIFLVAAEEADDWKGNTEMLGLKRSIAAAVNLDVSKLLEASSEPLAPHADTLDAWVAC
jgi:small GTP-binding protein